jgi:hypothetical protein
VQNPNDRDGRRSPAVSARRTTADGRKILRRGVWQAPFLGEDGQMVLVAVRRDGRLLCPPVTVPHGASRIEAGDRLCDALDEADPVPSLRIV